MSRPQPIEESSPAIEALLNYLIDTGDKPASYVGVSSFEADQKRKGKYQEYRMTVRDGRAIANQLSLEREGFIVVKHETKVKDFFDEEDVRSVRSEEHTSELQSQSNLVCRLLLEKKKKKKKYQIHNKKLQK